MPESSSSGGAVYVCDGKAHGMSAPSNTPKFDLI